ncbi:MAG TPA: hypothetical protein VJ813_20130 [Vicinamibacterales bacterium]|nr:hypothetical protein [Vicinamibacterales bacterium]
MSDKERGRLDSAIDRAVRGMMQIDPRPGLRHRVADRLKAPTRRGSWLMPALATAALCAVALVSIVWLRSSQTQPALVVPQVAVAPPAAPAGRPEIARVEPLAPEPRPVVHGRPGPSGAEAIFGPARGRVAAASITANAPLVDAPDHAEWIPVSIPALAPITIEPIRLQPISIPPLTVSARPERK